MVFQASKRNTVRRCLKTAAPRSTMLLTQDLRDKCWSTLEMGVFGGRRVCWSTLEMRAVANKHVWEPSVRKPLRFSSSAISPVVFRILCFSSLVPVFYLQCCDYSVKRTGPHICVTGYGPTLLRCSQSARDLVKYSVTLCRHLLSSPGPLLCEI